MPLILSLKPGERLILAGAVIKNGATVSHLQIENQVTILRQKDILTDSAADTPCKKLYLAIQLMYIGDGLTPELAKVYWDLARDVLEAAPSTNDLISQISAYIVALNFYPALKVAKKLISYEEELMQHATKSG
ncbi:MAG: flagellar biosynthesis repressor FlbT [Desulfuromonadaceae bacterium]|nr:flagellar biosynthesis repressor FlbT [Desulfuromonadaceae bacterium]MDD2853900.1 flagellar biosynthesis repressor FlbT [Desulfuromonadaceae bacterium]